MQDSVAENPFAHYVSHWAASKCSGDRRYFAGPQNCRASDFLRV